MQEQKDVKVINFQPPKANPPGNGELRPDEEKLLDLMAKLIVDVTLKQLTTIGSNVDSLPEKV